MKKLQNKVAVITGAGSGIGKAIALLFASEGSRVVATDINSERLDILQKEVSVSGGAITTLVADVANQEDVDGMVDTAVLQYGTLDILVNNAGIMDHFAPAGDLDNETWEKVMKTNIDGPFKSIRKALEIFIPKTKGVIINIAPISGLYGSRGGAAYTACKHALVGLTQNTGYMYARAGIKCNAIAPGQVNTNISESIDFSKSTPMMRERIMTGLELAPRVGAPEEVAKVALFLASDDSSFINGAVITVDGGWNAY